MKIGITGSRKIGHRVAAGDLEEGMAGARCLAVQAHVDKILAELACRVS